MGDQKTKPSAVKMDRSMIDLFRMFHVCSIGSFPKSVHAFQSVAGRSAATKGLHLFHVETAFIDVLACLRGAIRTTSCISHTRNIKQHTSESSEVIRFDSLKSIMQCISHISETSRDLL